MNKLFKAAVSDGLRCRSSVCGKAMRALAGAAGGGGAAAVITGMTSFIGAPVLPLLVIGAVIGAAVTLLFQD